MRRRATIAAQFVKLGHQLADDAITMFCKPMGRLFSRTNNRKRQRQAESHQDTAKALRLCRDILRAPAVASDTRMDALEIVDQRVGWHKLLRVQPLI